MTTSNKSKLVKTNTILWLTVIALQLLQFPLSSWFPMFPWPIILPLLLIGPMLASNNMMTKAIGNAKDDAA
jgi:hypothetical protein